MAASDSERYWVGFDLGGTKMLAKVYDDAFGEHGKKRKKTRGMEGAKAGVQRICSTIADAIQESGIDPGKLAGIGVGSPGPLDLERGVIIDTPNLGWQNVKLKATLEKVFGCPALILNDVDAGVYGEYERGAARGTRCAVGIFPGTGIGGGAVYDGALVRGKTQSCFEIGHVPVEADGPLCGCGKRGCLEAVASRLSISAAVAAAAYRGEAPTILEAAGTDLSNIRSGLLAEAVEAGDQAVIDILTHSARRIGWAAAGVVHLLAPEVLVLGGGLVEAMPKLYVAEVEAGLKAQVMPAFRDTCRVASAELGDDASVLGAAAWARAQFGP